MILQALTEYYEILLNAGEITAPGYSRVGVSYALNLSPEGELLNVVSLKIPVERGKKTIDIPQPLEVPEQVKKTSGIASNFLCENSSYALGIGGKGGEERILQCFDCFRTLHHTILDSVPCIPAKALLLFLDQWQPESAPENNAINEKLAEITAGINLIFSVQGYGYVQNDPLIRKAWQMHRNSTECSLSMPCLVTGKVAPVARLHPVIKGVRGTQAMGASLIAFNAPAYESFDHEQGQNAPVSEYAAFAYTTALNQLLSNDSNKMVGGDTTILFWAASPKKIYQQLFAYSTNPGETDTADEADKEAEKILHDVFQKVVAGQPIADVSSAFDPGTRFYILGLAPNAARLSVRFFTANNFGNILENIAQHYRDLEIEHSPKDFTFLPLWKLLSETVPPASRDKSASPLLAGEVMRSILNNTPYPATLFNAVLLRVRAEHEISRGKAAIIKAYLIRNRNNENYKEVLTVSLNEQSNNRAYILGRLFAVLEKAQQDATPGINTTIKDRYFTSACATPASVFPILLRLSNHHIAKSEYGLNSEHRISDLMEKLDIESDPFPAHLTLNEQGLFILGYYHQRNANYTKQNKEDK